MKQKLFLFLALILMAAVLVGLNAASYVEKERTPDSEFAPNRSSFNAGATGTSAFYTLLAETGRRPMRWKEPPSSLGSSKVNGPSVFVVTGTVRREFTDPEIKDLLYWVSIGGRLVLIDRSPPEELVVTTSNWKLHLDESEDPSIFRVDPSDQIQMIAGMAAIKGVQPTLLTEHVNAVQPSRFAASVDFEKAAQDNSADAKQLGQPPPPSNPATVSPSTAGAPVVHFASEKQNLLVDIPYGSGRIVILSDPYIVSNGGIPLADNAQLAVNLVSSPVGAVAFDEYHQGYGNDNNRFLQFFEGTPVVAIFLQAAVLIGFVFFSQSRRFARPIPAHEPDRLSKLEYVAAMAEIQNRTNAFDLAIENIYNDFRRRAARFFGVDNLASNSRDIAMLIAERTGLDPSGTFELLHKCEEIVRGEPTNRKEVLHLAESLREIELKIGIARSGRTRI